MEMNVLRAELERMFELDELKTITHNLLGLDPEEVGGTTGKGSFVRALTEHCAETDSIEALCEAILHSKGNAGDAIVAICTTGLPQRDGIENGSQFGPFDIVRCLGEGRSSITYLARRDGQDYRVKVLRHETGRDLRALRRFQTLTRVANVVSHPALPEGVETGTVDGRCYVAHAFVEAQPLLERIERTGAMHINEARELLQGILAPLCALHEARVVHGALKLENVLIVRDGDDQKVLLLDAGTHSLRSKGPVNGRSEVIGISSPETVSPEQLEGYAATPRSDLYAFGAIMYRVLSGRAVFESRSAMNAAVQHLTVSPPPPSQFAPRGWVGSEVDEFVLRLLAKDPKHRPDSAHAVLESLANLGLKAPATMADDDVQAKIDQFLSELGSPEAALKLEGCIDQGAPATRIAETFAAAAATWGTDTEAERETSTALLFRAARLYQLTVQDFSLAEQTYSRLLEIRPNDEVVVSSLESLRQQLGLYDELVEWMLERAEAAEDVATRTDIMARIGDLYANDLEDSEQAVVAYTQAFCEDPKRRDYAERIEGLAGSSTKTWDDVLSQCAETSATDIGPELKLPLFQAMGRWYSEKVSRADLALSCFQAVLSMAPSDDDAMVGCAKLYRKAKQWVELGAILMQRAQSHPSGEVARNLKSEAAGILETKINDAKAARELYEEILEQDPSHQLASESLERVLRQSSDFEELANLLDRRSSGQRESEALDTRCQAAALFEVHLDNTKEATRRYQDILRSHGGHPDALRGLDEIYSKTEQFNELLENLQAQIRISATPRQKITLLERIAGIEEEEFLNPGEAAIALESVLLIDPEHDASMTSLARYYRNLDNWDELADLLDSHAALVQEPERRIAMLIELGEVTAERLADEDRAITAYEKVVGLEASHDDALEALARLRESAGNASAALNAIEALAEKAGTPALKAEQYLRAAKLLESRGDSNGAIKQFKRAMDANPEDANIASALRQAYSRSGDANAAIELLDREIERTDGDAAKATLAAEMAELYRDQMNDPEGANNAAGRALDFDPTNIDALIILGDLSYDGNRFIEAAAKYERLTKRLDALDDAVALHALKRYIDSLRRGGSVEKALGAIGRLQKLAPDDPEVLLSLATITFEHGDSHAAVDAYRSLLDRFGDTLASSDKADATYGLGESLRKTAQLEECINVLEDAADLNPSSSLPLIALESAYEGLGHWEKVADTKTRHLDLADGDTRVSLLIAIASIAAEKLDDRPRAAKNLVAAVEARPDDRKLLTRLMQLYSDDKDWKRLVDVVLKLADFVDDDAQKAKYLQTAALVTAREMGDVDQALEYYDRAMELDPNLVKALTEALELMRKKGDFNGCEKLLRKKIKATSKTKQTDQLLAALLALGKLFRKDMEQPGDAIDAYEAAQVLDPDNKERAEILAELYTTDPEKHLNKAVAAQMALLDRDPFRVESYKLMRRLYTETKQADAAWCLCQALYVLKLAEPDEETFFNRVRSEDPAYAKASISDDDWLELLRHPDADPLVTSIFALIESSVFAVRGKPLRELGYDPHFAIDLEHHPYSLSPTLHYASGVMGMQAPLSFENANDTAAMRFLDSNPPAIVLGTGAANTTLGPQAAAFHTARHLSYYRPGIYVCQLIESSLGLKSWMYAAIKMIAPQFPVAPELEGPVGDGIKALEQHMSPKSKDQLARIVSQLVRGSGALDVKKWLAGVDLTADRVGFLLCHDLETAIEQIRDSADSTSVDNKRRLKELVMFAISPNYFELRARLQIAVQ